MAPRAAVLTVGGALAPSAAACRPPSNQRFAIGQDDFLLDGKRLQLRCGEIHFARVPPEYWQHRLRAIKAMGLKTVCAYLDGLAPADDALVGLDFKEHPAGRGRGRL